MLTIIWLFIKSAFSAAWSFFLKLLPYILKFWREILIAVMFMLWQGEKTSHNATTQELATFKADIQKEAKKREADNKLNAILAQKKTDARELEHQQQLSQILSKGKSNEIITHRTIANLRSELRKRIEGYQAAGLLENDTSGLTERDSHTAIFGQLQETQYELDVCKEAGAIAAADYNFCKSYVETQQSILGVEND